MSTSNLSPIGDEHRRTAALTEVRRQFDASKELTDHSEILEKLDIGASVNIMLRKNVVQGVPSESNPDSYGKILTPSPQDSNYYHLTLSL